MGYLCSHGLDLVEQEKAATPSLFPTEESNAKAVAYFLLHCTCLLIQVDEATKVFPMDDNC